MHYITWLHLDASMRYVLLQLALMHVHVCIKLCFLLYYLHLARSSSQISVGVILCSILNMCVFVALWGAHLSCIFILVQK
jgi:hypothetical protein